MSDNYELYYKWFGIRADEMPTNAYRLLGVQLFEPDDDVIANAVQQRTSYLRSFLTSEHGAAAQQILNEFKQIEVCLLNPATKATYDEQLRALVATQPQPAPLQPLAPANNPGAPPINQADTAAMIASPTEAAVPTINSTTTPALTNLRPRPRKQKSVAVEMVKVILGGIAGLVLGYLFLGWVRPDIDPLGLFNREPVVEQKRIEPSQPTQPQQPQRPIRTNQPRVVNQPTTTQPTSTPTQPKTNPVVQSTTPNETTPDSTVIVSVPVEPASVTQSKTVSQPTSVVTSPPTAKPEDRSLSTLIEPKAPTPSADADIPSAGDLPPLLVRTPRLLTTLPQAAGDDCKLMLLTDAVDIENNGQFRAFAVEDNTQRKWQTVIETDETEGQPKKSDPIAEFTIDDRDVQFQWLEGVNNLSSEARQLQNCVLEISNGTETHSLPLRTPVKSDDYTLMFEGRVNVHPVEIEYPPKSDAIFLELASLDKFPTPGTYRNELQIAGINRELAIQLTDLEGAEIEIKLIKRTDGSMSLLVSPVYKAAGSEFELTPDRLTAIKDGSTRALVKANQDLSENRRELSSLESQYRSLSRQSGGNAQEQVIRAQQMGGINKRARTVSKRITTLQKNIVEMQARIAAVPKAEAIVNKVHNQAKLPFRVYAVISGQEIDLLRSGWN